MVFSRPIVVSSLVLLLGSQTDAFLASPLLGHAVAKSSTRASITGAAAARCSADAEQKTLGLLNRRDAMRAAAAGVLALPLAPAFAEEEAEAAAEPTGAVPAEVTYKVDDDLCEKHPTWKQCKKKKTVVKGPAKKMDNGLEYVELTLGKGITPKQGDTVTVHYSLYYKGDEIQSSRESSGLAAAPLGFQYGVKSGAGAVVPAINLGITDMKVGGVRKVTAPPELAFGEKGKKPRIPPNATVQFDIQLLSVKRAGTNPISSQGGGSEKKQGVFDLF